MPHWTHKLREELEAQDAWVLLWSHRQNALHVEPLSRMLQSNRTAYADNRAMDYVPLYIGDKTMVESIASSVRGTMRVREDARNQQRRTA